MFSDDELRIIAQYEQLRQEWMELNARLWQLAQTDKEYKRMTDLDATLCGMEDRLPDKYEYPKTL